jgi:hypothetical protein
MKKILIIILLMILNVHLINAKDSILFADKALYILTQKK